MTGEEFVTLAGKLAASPQADEATYRTAVSRAYYGAFHVVRRLFEMSLIPINRDHGELQRCLLESGHAQCVEIGKHLGDLQTSRVKADYDLSPTPIATARHARKCAELAHTMCSSINRITADDRHLLRDGIEAYRRQLAQGRSR